MTTFIVTPDPWAAKQEELRKRLASSSKTTQKNSIRRPTRGIVLNDDTFASLRVVTTHGANIPLVDAGSRAMERNIDDAIAPLEINGKRANNVYSNFLLQSITESRTEKYQILETFGEPYIFLFGERASVMNFSGILANTFDFNWEAEWWFNYDNYIRGTKCVENGASVFLSFDNTLVSGYIISASAQKSAQDRNFVQFSFQLYVTSYTTLTNLGDPHANPGFNPTSVTSQSLQALRPKLIDNVTQSGVTYQQLALSGGVASGGGLFGTNYATMGALAQSAVDKTIQLFDTIQRYGNTYARLMNNIISGSVVRVPVGFAGSMVFDSDSKIVTVNEINVDSKAVTFTVFSENDDEYVGRSDHYGIPMDGNNGNLTLRQFNFENDLNGQYQKATLQVMQAKRIWEQAGQTVPLESFLTKASAEIAPIKKLGVTIYSGVQTGAGLVSVFSKPNTSQNNAPAPAWKSQVTGPLSLASNQISGSGSFAHLVSGYKAE